PAARPRVEASALLFPAAAVGLLPVGRLVPGRADTGPRRACAPDRVGIVAVEEEDDALVAGEIAGFGAVGEEADAGAVRIVAGGGQPDGLVLGESVPGGAVRQEALLAVGPQVGVERVAALLGADLDDGAPPPLEALLEQFRQHTFERMPIEMVE